MKTAKCKERMQEALRPKRAYRGGGVGAIDVHGGRIVQLAGRKDRHSKVCTAKGPRDRRVRLSPNTAIQFYDVQDRLGYDRPSKAIDWLMKEAKAAIDALDHEHNNSAHHARNLSDYARALVHPSADQDVLGNEETKSGRGFHSQECLNDISIGNFSLFSVENGGGVVAAPPAVVPTEFLAAYPNGGDPSSRNRIQANGLSLSFHSCQDCSFFFSNGQEQQQGLILDSTPSHSHCCEANSEEGRFQKLLGWNSYNSSNGKDSHQESLIDSLQPLHFPSDYDERNQLHLQREPLQSSFRPAIRDPLHDYFSNLNYAGCGFRFPGDGLSVFPTAARIQGRGEQNNPTSSSKPSSATTSLLHYLGEKHQSQGPWNRE